MPKLRCLTLFASTLLLLMAGSASAVPVQWSSSVGGNDHFYDVIPGGGPITWDQARADALSRGGDLASIESAAENAFVFTLVDDPAFWTPAGPFNYGPWIGGIQLDLSNEPAGGWTWSDGNPWGFTAWASGQPDNNGNAEHNAHFFVPSSTRGSTWNDWTGGGLLINSYVFESTVPEPSTGLLVGLGLVALGYRKRRH